MTKQVTCASCGNCRVRPTTNAQLTKPVDRAECQLPSNYQGVDRCCPSLYREVDSPQDYRMHTCRAFGLTFKPKLDEASAVK